MARKLMLWCAVAAVLGAVIVPFTHMTTTPSKVVAAASATHMT